MCICCHTFYSVHSCPQQTCSYLQSFTFLSPPFPDHWPQLGVMLGRCRISQTPASPAKPWPKEGSAKSGSASTLDPPVPGTLNCFFWPDLQEEQCFLRGTAVQSYRDTAVTLTGFPEHIGRGRRLSRGGSGQVRVAHPALEPTQTQVFPSQSNEGNGNIPIHVMGYKIRS